MKRIQLRDPNQVIEEESDDEPNLNSPTLVFNWVPEERQIQGPAYVNFQNCSPDKSLFKLTTKRQQESSDEEE